jgi:hypothetical protein
VQDLRPKTISEEARNNFTHTCVCDRYVNPDEELFKKAEDSLKYFKEKFVFVKTELKEKENRRRNWSEAFLRDEDVTLESYMAGGEKKKQKLGTYPSTGIH